MEKKLIVGLNDFVRGLYELGRKYIGRERTYQKEDIAEDERRAYQENMLRGLRDYFIESVGDSIENFRKISVDTRSGKIGFLIPRKIITLGGIEPEDLEED